MSRKKPPGPQVSESHQTTPAAPCPPEGATDSRSVLTLITELRAGTVSGNNLAAIDRRRVVEHLGAEGYTAPEISQVLGISERTVHRDRVFIREAHAVAFRPELLAEQVGQLLRQSEITAGRLRRIARDRDTPPQTRVDAERACFITVRETFQSLQSVGYLPTAPAQFIGQITAGGGGILSYQELSAEAERVARVVGLPAQALTELASVRDECQRLALTERLRSAIDAAQAPEPREPPAPGPGPATVGEAQPGMPPEPAPPRDVGP